MNLKSVEMKWTENGALGTGEVLGGEKQVKSWREAKSGCALEGMAVFSQCERRSNVIGIKNILALSLLI